MFFVRLARLVGRFAVLAFAATDPSFVCALLLELARELVAGDQGAVHVFKERLPSRCA
jgi:hypothetical protein